MALSLNLSSHSCVRSDLVKSSAGSYTLIWNDRGSGAKTDVALWANSGSVEANTFTAFATHAHPGGRPDLLNPTKIQYATSVQELWY